MPEIYNAETPPPTTPSRTVADYSEVLRSAPKSNNPFSAFIAQPGHTRMEIQAADEKILLLLRRHPITNLGWILILLLMILAPILFMPLVDVTFLPADFRTATLVLWYLLTLGIGLEGFLSWYYNVYIITDERVIDVDFLNLLYKNISAAKIDNIEDVTVKMSGSIQNVLNFGTVLIQTAGERIQFEFEDVPQPQEVSKFINELMLEEEREQIEGRAT